MTTTSTDIATVQRITSTEEAERLGLAAYEALIADLRLLTPQQWDTTTVCDPWTIADMVRHVLGAAKSNASIREMVRQQIHGARHKADFGDNALDATNDLQVLEHRGLEPDELVAELVQVFPGSVRTRARRPRIMNRINIPVDAGGSTADGMPRRLSLGELFRVVYTRDVWLHRVDIARALGREPAMDPVVDGRLIADVVKEWADRHGEPFDLHLTGPAGGRFRRPGPGPTIEQDAVEFCWLLSGRGTPDTDDPGASLLAYRVFF